MAGKRKSFQNTKNQKHSKKQKGPSLRQTTLIGHFSHPVQSGHDSNPVLPVMSNEVEEEADPPESFTLQPTNISEPFISDKHSESCSSSDSEPPQATPRNPFDFFSNIMPLSSITEEEFLDFLFHESRTGLVKVSNGELQGVSLMSVTSNQPNTDEDLVKPKEKSKAQQGIPRDHVVNLQRTSTECGQPGHENMINNKCEHVSE